MTIAYTGSLNGPNAVRGDPATGVIKQVDWRMDATDGIYSAFATGTMTLLPMQPTDPAFVPLHSVTKDVLVAWVEAAAGAQAITALKARLASAIADQQPNPAAPAPLQLTIQEKVPV